MAPTGLRNIFEDKADADQEDAMADDTAEVDEAFSKLVEHPNMKILPAGMYLKIFTFMFNHHCRSIGFKQTISLSMP